jgi:hypothetical protein
MMLWYKANEKKTKKRRTIGDHWKYLIHRSSRYMRWWWLQTHALSMYSCSAVYWMIAL